MYWLPRSITICGTCEDAALSRYTSGLPCTVWLSTGKSLRMRSTSQTSTGLGLIVINCSKVAISSNQLSEHHPRRLQRPLKWIEHETKLLKRHNSQQRLIAGLSQNHWRVCLALGQVDVTLRNVALDLGSIREHKSKASLGLKSDRFPALQRQQSVFGTAIDKKLIRCLLPSWAGYRSFNVSDSHSSILRSPTQVSSCACSRFSTAASSSRLSDAILIFSITSSANPYVKTLRASSRLMPRLSR